MSKIEEIEHAVEQLPIKDFVKLAVWVDRRRQQLEISPATDKRRMVVRDHSAFLTRLSLLEGGFDFF
jgi:hypothetical protein